MSYTWDGQQGPFEEAEAVDEEVIAGWMKLYDPGTNKPYFWHTVTGVVQWEVPVDFEPGADSPIVRAALTLQRAFRKPRFGSPMAIKRITKALRAAEAEKAAEAAKAVLLTAESAAASTAAAAAGDATAAALEDPAAAGGDGASPATRGDEAADADAAATSPSTKKKRRSSLFGGLRRNNSATKGKKLSRKSLSIDASGDPTSPTSPTTPGGAHRLKGTLSFQVDMDSKKDRELASLKMLSVMTPKSSSMTKNLLMQKMKKNAAVKMEMLKKSASFKKKALEESMRREQLDRNFCDAAWVEPSAHVAKTDMFDSVFENGTAPCCTTRLAELGRLGIGVRLYFEVVRMLCIVFLVMGIMSLPTIILGLLGDRTDDDPQMQGSLLAGTTLANLNVFIRRNVPESHQYLVPESPDSPLFVWKDYDKLTPLDLANATASVECNTRNPWLNATRPCRQFVCLNYPQLPEWTTMFSLDSPGSALGNSTSMELSQFPTIKEYYDWTSRQNSDKDNWRAHCNLDARWALLMITACDTIATIFYIVMMFRFVTIAANITTEVDDQNVTAIDYAVNVKGIPWDVKKADLANHFTQLYDLENWTHKLEQEAALRKAKRQGASAVAREKAQQRRAAAAAARSGAKVHPEGEEEELEEGGEGVEIEDVEEVGEVDLEAAEGDDAFYEDHQWGADDGWGAAGGEHQQQQQQQWDEGGYDAGYGQQQQYEGEDQGYYGQQDEGYYEPSGEDWDDDDEDEDEYAVEEEEEEVIVRDNVVTAMLAQSAIELKPVGNNLMVSPVTEVDGKINYKGGWVAEVALVHPHGKAITQFESFMETLEEIRTVRATIQKYSDGSPWRREVLNIWEKNAAVRVRDDCETEELHQHRRRKGIIIECTAEDEDMMTAKVRLRDGTEFECSPHDDLEIYCLAGVTAHKHDIGGGHSDRWMKDVARWAKDCRIRVRDDSKTPALRKCSGMLGTITALLNSEGLTGEEGTASLLLDDGTMIDSCMPYLDCEFFVLPGSKPPRTPHLQTEWVWCACCAPCRYFTQAFPEQDDAFTHINQQLFAGAIEEYEYFPLGVWCFPSLACHPHRLRQKCCCGKFDGEEKKNPACPEAPEDANCCAKFALCWMTMWTCCCFPQTTLGADNDTLIEAEAELADLEVHTKKLKELKVMIDPLAFQKGPFRMFWRECCRWMCRQPGCKCLNETTACERCATPDLFDTVNRETRKATRVHDVTIAAYVVFNHDESYSLALEDYAQSKLWTGRACDMLVDSCGIRRGLNKCECDGFAPEGCYTRMCEVECGGGVTMERTCNKWFGCQMRELHFHQNGERFRLEVERAPEPGAILYENVEVSACSRFLRQMVTYTVTILMLMASMLVISMIENRAAVFMAGQPGSCTAPRETHFDMSKTNLDIKLGRTSTHSDALFVIRDPTLDAACPKPSMKSVTYQSFDDYWSATGEFKPSSAGPSDGPGYDLIEKYRNNTCYGDDVTKRATGVLSLRECVSSCVDPSAVGLCPSYACLQDTTTPCDDEYARQSCQYTRKTIAACYCSGGPFQDFTGIASNPLQLIKEILGYDVGMCAGVTRDYVLNKLLETALLAVLLSIMNMLLETMMDSLSVFERHAVYSDKVRALAFKLFMAQFISTAMIVELANLDSEYSHTTSWGDGL